MLITMVGVLKVMSATAITSTTVLSMWDAMPDGMDRVPIALGLAAGLGFSRYRLDCELFMGLYVCTYKYIRLHNK